NAPQPEGQSVEVAHNGSSVITLFAYDPDGDPISYDIASGPVNGVLTGLGTSRTYVPNPNFQGADSFVFEARDNRGGFASATVLLTVDGPPVSGEGVVPPRAEGVTIPDLTDQWRLIALAGSYASPVIVCTPEYGV